MKIQRDDELLLSESAFTEKALAAIEAGQAQSRADVARHLGLSRTTASTLVGNLIGLNLLAERNVRREGRGRPGIILDLDESRWRAIGAEYHSGRWSFAETNLKGSIVRTESRPVESPDPECFLAELLSGLDSFMRHATGDLLPTVGIGTPGLVDRRHGTILRADDLGWIDVQVASAVENRLGIPALTINRNRASGLAEARFGAGRAVCQFLYIGIGTGISAAIFLDGALVNGATFGAGEIGHMVIERDGPRCGCGKRGCLQALASGGALVRMARARMAAGDESSLVGFGDRLTGEDICRAALSGDATSRACLREAGSWLGITVANLVTVFNPDKVIIGGPIGLQEGPLLDHIRDSARGSAMPHAFKAASIERAALGEEAGALGAACMVLDRKLELAIRGSRGVKPRS